MKVMKSFCQKLLNLLPVLAIFCVAAAAFLPVNRVFAGSCGGVDTAIIDCSSSNSEEAFFSIIGSVVNILTYGVGVGAVAGFTYVGFLYMTSQNDPGKIKIAKDRAMQIVIGLLVYALMWGILNFLLPGGIYGKGN